MAPSFDIEVCNDTLGGLDREFSVKFSVEEFVSPGIRMYPRTPRSLPNGRSLCSPRLLLIWILVLMGGDREEAIVLDDGGLDLPSSFPSEDCLKPDIGFGGAGTLDAGMLLRVFGSDLAAFVSGKAGACKTLGIFITTSSAPGLSTSLSLFVLLMGLLELRNACPLSFAGAFGRGICDFTG